VVVVGVVVVVVGRVVVVVDGREVDVVVEVCSTEAVVWVEASEAQPDNRRSPPIRRAAKPLLRPDAM